MELRGGVEVTFVETASPAWDGGLREGDVLLSVNREAVHGPEEYHKAVARLPRGRAAHALVYREGAPLYVALRGRGDRGGAGLLPEPCRPRDREEHELLQPGPGGCPYQAHRAHSLEDLVAWGRSGRAGRTG